jgi:uncharacterized protein YeaO (DUF488 family)
MTDRGFRLKRVYEAPAVGDGLRVLVDRLWPRGISKDRIDLWVKDVSPSDALRKEFHGQPDKWDEFVIAYRLELAQEPGKSAAADLLAKAKKQSVTLLYAARDEERNNAVALKMLLGESKG